MRVKCPKCGSHAVSAANTTKKFSTGKAVKGGLIGGLIFGPIGLVVGGTASGVRGKNGKTTFVCCNCGKVFEKKI